MLYSLVKSDSQHHTYSQWSGITNCMGFIQWARRMRGHLRWSLHQTSFLCQTLSKLSSAWEKYQALGRIWDRQDVKLLGHTTLKVYPLLRIIHEKGNFPFLSLYLCSKHAFPDTMGSLALSLKALCPPYGCSSTIWLNSKLAYLTKAISFECISSNSQSPIMGWCHIKKTNWNQFPLE